MKLVRYKAKVTD